MKRKRVNNKNKKLLLQSIVFEMLFLVLLILKIELIITLIFFLLCLIFIITFSYKLINKNN